MTSAIEHLHDFLERVESIPIIGVLGSVPHLVVALTELFFKYVVGNMQHPRNIRYDASFGVLIYSGANLLTLGVFFPTISCLLEGIRRRG